MTPITQSPSIKVPKSSTTCARASAGTVGVRGDDEYRPAQGQADVFVSLLFGYHDYDVH